MKLGFASISLCTVMGLVGQLAAQPAAEPAAQRWLDKIKQLQGDWTTPGSDEVVVRYKVIAGGSAVMETDFPGQHHEMISLYHLDGQRLVMQHYCMLQNQPRFEAALPDSGSTLEFNLIGGTNLDPAEDTHIHHGKIIFESADRLRSEWTAYTHGKPSETHAFELVRTQGDAGPTTQHQAAEGKKPMTRFLFVYRSTEDRHKAEISPEQMQKLMEAWNAWIGQGMHEGWMVDPGDALTLEGRIVNHDKLVSDGPFAESKEIVGGFSIVQAEDFDAACELAKTCPATNSPGNTVEVRQLAGFASK